ncbi:MAG TPA: osmotically inducible protein C, partial [Nitrospiraceae bacterium]|nr:osmotically inducible protein C [Nitrospiraceae bacterium]
MDVRGFLGISNTVRSGFQNILGNFKVNIDADNIEKLKTLNKLSPVFDMTSHG